MANTTILYSKGGNCSVLNPFSVHNPYSDISMVTSRRAAVQIAPNMNETETETVHGEKIDILGQQLAEIQRLDRAKEYTDLGDLTVAHIAGMVEWRVLNSRHFDCGDCKTVLTNEKKIQQSFLNGKQTVKPCQSTFDVCFTAEHFLKLEILKGQFKLSAIQYAIISSLDCESLYAGADFLGHVDHKLYMIKPL